MASAKETIYIEITGDSSEIVAALKKAGVEFKNFSKESEGAGKAGKNAGMGARDIVKGLAGFAIVQQSAQMLKEFAIESFNAAAQAERLGQATDNLSKRIGESGSEMVSAITEASGQTISQLGAMEAANKAMMFGLVENKGQMAELTQIAVTLGAAMGQDATKSIDDLTTALGRQSPMILDNLGITLKMEEAHRIYAEQLGKTVEQLTEEEKKQAFVNAALEKGKQKVAELGDATTGSAADTERLSAAWSDFQVAFGGLLSEMSGGLNTVTSFVRKLEKGAVAWQGVFDNAGKIRDAKDALDEHIGKTITTVETYEQLKDALREGARDFDLVADALARNTGSYDDYTAKLDELAEADYQMKGSLASTISLLRMSEDEYNAVKAAAADASQELARNAETLRMNAMAAAYAAEQQAELENRQRAQSAETDRWNAMAQASTQTLDELAQGHLMTAAETEKYAEAQEHAAQAEAERQAMMQGLAGAMADYFLSLKDMQDQSIQGEANYHASIASMRADAQADIAAKETELSDKLVELEQQRQEKIQWVLSGAHDRTQEENDEALAYWNAHYDQLVGDTEAKYGEQTAAMEAALAEQESAAAAAHAREQAEYDAHLEELKLKTALGVLETTGQLEQLTGGLATSAGDAVALIEAGIIPVTEQMALAIQGSLGEMAAKSEEASTTAASNQEILQQALSGTLEGVGGVGSEIDLLNEKFGDTSAIDGFSAALAGIGSGGGGGLEGEGGGGEGEDEGGGGSGLAGMVSTAEQLNSLFGMTLPASLTALQEGHTIFAETALEEQALLLEAVILLDTALLKISEETIPPLHDRGVTMLNELTTGFKTATNAAISGFNDAKSAVERAHGKLKELPDTLNEILEILGAIESAAQRAAGAMSRLHSGGGDLPGRAAGGPVEAGRAYVVGEHGPEVFLAPTDGRIIPNYTLNSGGGGAMSFEGGGSSQQLIIQNVNIYESSNPRQSFEMIKREAERRGYRFSRN